MGILGPLGRREGNELAKYWWWWWWWGGGDKVNTDFIPNMTSASEDNFLIVTHMSSVREIPFEVQLTR